MYDYLVFIGRFQPFHNGHKKVIDEARKQSKKVIVLVGSANSARSHRNPWTFEERKEMILSAYDPNNIPDRERGRSPIIVMPLNDYAYNDLAWTKQVRDRVQKVILDDFHKDLGSNFHTHGINDVKVGLVGYAKDHSSYYLKMFPGWANVDVPQHVVYNATDIRSEYFRSTPRIPERIVPHSVAEFMDDFLHTEDFKQIFEEYKYIENYKKAWGNAPYAPVFVTVDAVVVQSGHILVVRRKANPGKGLMALPGGFIDQNEYIEDAMIRELREETKLKVPVPVLRGNIKKMKVFDDPHRSARGRTITHAYLINLPAQEQLPPVKGGSDATRADWVPINSLKAEEMFEDHFHIVQNLTGDL